MGQRGESYSTRVFVDDGRKTFFFNVKENRYSDTYISIVESRKTDRGFKRTSVIVFREDLGKFLEMLNETADAISRQDESPEKVLHIGGGRRTYRFRLPPAGTPALQVTEKREDSTGKRQESIYVSVRSLAEFLRGLGKAADFVLSQGKGS